MLPPPGVEVGEGRALPKRMAQGGHRCSAEARDRGRSQVAGGAAVTVSRTRFAHGTATNGNGGSVQLFSEFSLDPSKTTTALEKACKRPSFVTFGETPGGVMGLARPASPTLHPRRCARVFTVLDANHHANFLIANFFMVDHMFCILIFRISYQPEGRRKGAKPFEFAAPPQGE